MKPEEVKISEKLSVKICPPDNRIEITHKNGVHVISLTHEELRSVIGVHTKYMRETNQGFIIDDGDKSA